MWQDWRDRCCRLRSDVVSGAFCVSLVLGLTLSACTPASTPTPAPTSTPTTASLPTETTPVATQPAPAPLGLRIEVVSWLSNERPRQGERIILIASLAVNGELTSGEWMRASWPDHSAPGGSKLCRDTPSYARGVCYITIGEQYPVGQPVPIAIELLRQGVWHRGEISFTPQ